MTEIRATLRGPARDLEHSRERRGTLRVMCGGLEFQEGSKRVRIELADSEAMRALGQLLFNAAADRRMTEIALHFTRNDEPIAPKVFP